jgi:hypothetical protein
MATRRPFWSRTIGRQNRTSPLRRLPVFPDRQATGAGLDPKWKSINLAATVRRFTPVQEWLNCKAHNAQAPVPLARQFGQPLAIGP